MPANRFKRWLFDTFHDMWFRSLIGPAQTTNAVQGCDQQAPSLDIACGND